MKLTDKLIESLANGKARFQFLVENRQRQLEKLKPVEVREGEAPTASQRLEMLKKQLDFHQRAHRLSPNLDDVYVLIEKEISDAMAHLFTPGMPSNVIDFDRGLLALAFTLLDRIRNAEKNLSDAQLAVTMATAEATMQQEIVDGALIG